MFNYLQKQDKQLRCITLYLHRLASVDCIQLRLIGYIVWVSTFPSRLPIIPHLSRHLAIGKEKKEREEAEGGEDGDGDGEGKGGRGGEGRGRGRGRGGGRG